MLGWRRRRGRRRRRLWWGRYLARWWWRVVIITSSSCASRSPIASRIIANTVAFFCFYASSIATTSSRIV
uniref:Uncharacterized protein n=1 Tax=Panstrongylus lignarius TaxID=156445 RepID=A0A224Y124_9HEMI